MIAVGRQLLLGAWLVACHGGGDPGATDPPEPPWPEEREELPPCEPIEWTEPTLAAPSGLVQITASTDRIALGVVETLAIEVLEAGGVAVDTSVAGELAIEVDGGQLLSATPVVDGRATAKIRLDRAGVATVDASLAGSAPVGRIELFGYRSQLPIWTLELAEADLASLVADPSARIEVPAVLSIDGERHPVEMRVHGGSSRGFPKLSFRLNLTGGLTTGGRRHLIVRAEYNDKSMLRHWAALDLIRNGSWLPAPRSELVHLRINDRFHGVMHNVEAIDGDFLLDRGLSPGGELFEADPPADYSSPGGNLTPLADEDYPIVYPQHAGGGDHDSLVELIEGYLQLDAETFAAIAGEIIAVDDYLVFLAMLAVIQSHDHVRKNYFLYREAGYADERWRALPWDLELTFGHLWTESGDVLDEQLFFEGDLFVGVRAADRGGYYNQLTDLVLADPGRRARFLDFVEHIAGDGFDQGVLAERLDNVACRAGLDILADRQKRASNAEYLDRVSEIVEFARRRRVFIDAELDRFRD